MPLVWLAGLHGTLGAHVRSFSIGHWIAVSASLASWTC